MPAEHYEKARLLLSRLKDIDRFGPFPKSLVDRAEQILGVCLPPSYRRFLCEYGCLGVLSEEIYGIVDDDLHRGPVPNGIWLTLEERKAASLDKRFVVVQSTGYGGWYAIDTGRSSPDHENPIVLLGQDTLTLDDVAEDFSEFFLQTVVQALDSQVG